jgi:hypothetical protein
VQRSPVEKYMPLAARVWVLKEDILFLEIVYFFILGGAAKLRWVGWRAAPRWAWQ